jgi:hypothetical protein
MGKMRIGNVVQRAGVAATTIRYLARQLPSDGGTVHSMSGTGRAEVTRAGRTDCRREADERYPGTWPHLQLYFTAGLLRR